eukprot:COSAG02_NODE_7081_length_3194_cov_2.330210_3_plen_111_part_00
MHGKSDQNVRTLRFYHYIPIHNRITFAACVRRYEHDEVVKHWHEQAHFKLRRKNRPDYYELLGVPKVNVYLCACLPECFLTASIFGLVRRLSSMLTTVVIDCKILCHAGL